jgi:hypothetical protein
MLCIDETKFKQTALEDVKLSWMQLMQQFERPASSPADRFLLCDNDPRLQQARQALAIHQPKSKPRREVDWSVYKGRHQNYRMDQELGHKRPLTRWEDNGTCKMPDFVWHDWTRTQGERVWDTLDMNFLRCILRGYDLNYKL